MKELSPELEELVKQLAEKFLHLNSLSDNIETAEDFTAAGEALRSDIMVLPAELRRRPLQWIGVKSRSSRIVLEKRIKTLP